MEKLCEFLAFRKDSEPFGQKLELIKKKQKNEETLRGNIQTKEWQIKGESDEGIRNMNQF